MLESQQNVSSGLSDTSRSNADLPQRSTSSYFEELQELVSLRGPVIVDGDALATIPASQPVGSPSEFLASLERMSRSYYEVLGEVIRTLRPEDSLANLSLEPIKTITQEQFAALVELFIERYKNQAMLPPFLGAPEAEPAVEVDGDILGLIPAASTIPFGEIESLSYAAAACKKLLFSADINVSEHSDVWPSRGDTVNLFVSILLQRRTSAKTVELPNLPCTHSQAYHEIDSRSLQTGMTSKLGHSPEHVPTHMTKHRRSA